MPLPLRWTVRASVLRSASDCLDCLLSSVKPLCPEPGCVISPLRSLHSSLSTQTNADEHQSTRLCGSPEDLTSMDDSSVSVLSYRRSKPEGKVRRRVQDLRGSFIPHGDYLPARSEQDLSHNESARLALDALLSAGVEEYQQVLKAEGEADFLSELEKNYILENGRDCNTVDSETSAEERTLESSSAGHQSATRTSGVFTGEPLNNGRAEKKSSDPDPGAESSVEVYLHSDNGAAGIKDEVRRFIGKAHTAVAIVADSFTDVELLCDLLDISRKRDVSVHLLLDALGLGLFVSLWKELNLSSKHFPKLSVRSINGKSYSARTGRKLPGQVTHTFIITDWTEVLTGSYSLSWLSWQVHRSLAVLITGGAVESFRQEFYRLHSGSAPVPGFGTFMALPGSPATRDHGGDISESRSSPVQTVDCRSWLLHAEMCQNQRGVTGAFSPRSSENGDLVPPGAGGSKLPPPGSVTRLRRIDVEPLDWNQNQVQNNGSYNHRFPPDPRFRTLPARPDHFRNRSHPNYDNPDTRRLLFGQRSRESLSGVPVGLNGLRGGWNDPGHFLPKAELPPDNPKLLPSPRLQPKQELRLPLTHSRGGSSPGPKVYRQPLDPSKPLVEAPKFPPTALGSLNPQTQPKFYPSDPAGRQNLQHLQHLQPPPRRDWRIQVLPNMALARPDSSLPPADDAGGPPGWRPDPGKTGAPLRRSKSCNERRSVRFRAAAAATTPTVDVDAVTLPRSWNLGAKRN